MTNQHISIIQKLLYPLNIQEYSVNKLLQCYFFNDIPKKFPPCEVAPGKNQGGI